MMREELGLIRRKVLSSMYPRHAALGNRGPIISFTFDDFPRSALTVGGRILNSYGLCGTYYASIGLMDGVSHLGDQFRRKDLDILLRDGHELASHTFGHISCSKVSCSTYREDVKEGRRAIERITGRPDFGNFAFPFGAVTLNAKRLIGQDVASSRSIWSGWNGPQVDLNLLRANSLYGNSDKCAQVKELILENERQKSWLIFYSHDVCPAPSRFGCTPELLQFAISFASRRCARIATIAEVVTELIASPLDEARVAEASV